MKSLVRIQSGQFTLSDSFRLSEVEQLRDEGTLAEHVITVERVFAACGKLQTKEETDKLLKNGNKIPKDALEVLETGKDNIEFPKQWFRAYTSEGSFLGIYEKKNGSYIPVKMFL